VVFAMQDFSRYKKLIFTKQQPAYISEEGWSQISASVARVYLATQDKSSVQSGDNSMTRR
jgi:hypothetical protein